MTQSQQKPFQLYDGRRSSTDSDSAKATEPSARVANQRRAKKRRLRRIVILCTCLVFVPLGLIGGAIYSATIVPDAYQQALDRDAAESFAAGERLELAVADFHNDIQAGGDWQLELGQAEVNGWLETHLANKFPGSLPKHIQAPRLVVDDRSTQLYLKVRKFRLTLIVHVTVEFYLTDSPNVIGAQIKRAHCGWIPVPVTSLMDSLALAIARSGIKIRWSQKDGQPLALLTVPDQVGPSSERRLTVLAIEQSDAAIRASGTMNLDR